MITRTLLIGDYEIPLGEMDIVPVNKQVYNIQDPSKTNSHFTKTIKVPASRTANQVFISYFDVSMTIESDLQFNPFFNPSKKVSASYFENTLPIIEGYAQLKNITNISGLIYYELVLIGENGDLFKELDNKKMSDLDLSKYDHEYSKANILDSWDGYNMVNGVRTNTGVGTGYLYPFVNNGSFVDLVNLGNINPRFVIVSNFDLWFYVTDLIKEIFAQSGYKFKSDFLESDLAKKLIFKGYGNARRTEEQIQDSLISASKVTHDITRFTNKNSLNLYANPLIFNTSIIDPNSEYDDTTGTITLNNSFDYDIYFESQVQCKFISTIASQVINYRVESWLIDDLGNIQFYDFHDYRHVAQLVPNPLGETINWNITIQRQNYQLDSARSYRFVFSVSYTAVGGAITAVYERLLNPKFEMFYNGSLDVNEVVNVNNLLNTEMTQKDFLMGVIKMFKLYVEPYYYEPTETDSGAYRTYLIEPRDYGYYVDRVVDWSAKLDESKEFIIEPIGLAKEKFFNYTYIEDNDYHNDMYKKMTNRIYGDLKVNIDNDFVSGTQEIKIPFSQMVLATRTDPQNRFTFPLPTDVKDDKGGRRTESKKPKIAFYNGTLACPSYVFADDLSQNVFNTMTNHSSYALACNYDNIFDPTTDLNFGQPEYLFYTLNNGDIVNGNIGLFDIYHKKELQEVNNKNSKVITAYFNLTPLDVHNLSFRPLYWFKDSYYRLYELIDYNGIDTTKCIFLKLTPALPHEKSVFRTKGGLGGGSQVYTDTINGNGRNYGHELIIGRDNTIGGESQVGIGGDQVVNLAHKILTINSNTYLNGSEGSPLVVNVDTSAGNVTLYLPDENFNLGKIIYVSKIHAAHQVIVKDSLDVLVDTITSIGSTMFIIE